MSFLLMSIILINFSRNILIITINLGLIFLEIKIHRLVESMSYYLLNFIHQMQFLYSEGYTMYTVGIPPPNSLADCILASDSTSPRCWWSKWISRQVVECICTSAYCDDCVLVGRIGVIFRDEVLMNQAPTSTTTHRPRSRLLSIICSLLCCKNFFRVCKLLTPP